MSRTKTIEHLATVNDSLIQMFKDGELQPIKESSAYHSPDISETDGEDTDNKRKIVTKDLKWRSVTVRSININEF